MNGIYDFESYKAPHLDVEMLMEYKAKKREKRLLVLAGVAAVLMATVAVLFLVQAASVDKQTYIVGSIIFAVYVVVGAIIAGTVLKERGDYSWALQ